MLTVALLASGCAKAKAASAPDGPPLAVPAPPPRVLAPADEPLASTPAPETPPATAPRAPARPAPRRPPAAGNAAPEPEPRPDTSAPAAPAPAAPVVTPPPEPPRELRPAVSAADAAEERKVRDVLNRAGRDLSRVDYRRLSTAGRSQYDQSKRFTEQAEQAIKDRNYVFATTLADKAAALAAELAGR